MPTIFIRIDYSSVDISEASIVENITETLEQCPAPIKTKIHTGLNPEQADYVTYAIEDNPI